MARITGAKAEILVDKFKVACSNKGYAFFESKDYNLNIIGVRNDSGKADKFDDNINVIYKIDGEWIVDVYPATTEPGVNILKRPIVKGGTAILVPGQYRGVYKLDTHGGKRKYRAVCQRLGNVKIWRDDNRDRTPDYTGPIHEGKYGINIHRQWGADDREYTGGVSAGCQVFQSSVDFYEFMETCQIAADEWSNKFTYTLLDERDL